MEGKQDERAPRRRGGDVLHREGLTAWQVLRRHLVVASWFGNLLFLLVGVWFGFYLGGYGGAKFFEVLFLMDLTGPIAAITGSIIGVVIGLLSVWAILIVVSAFCGALVYWIKYRSFPAPTK